MKQLITILFAMLMMLVTTIVLLLSGVLFDTGDKLQIQTVVFQPNNLSDTRIENPETLESFSDIAMRDKLIKNFIFEYFYVIPEISNIKNRMAYNSSLSQMSSSDVFEKWKNKTAVNINELVSNKKYRTVSIPTEIIQKGDFLEVQYELKTWEKSNDMETRPTVTRGFIYLKVAYENGLRETVGGKPFDANKYLESGRNPAAIFKFRVDELQEQR